MFVLGGMIWLSACQTARAPAPVTHYGASAGAGSAGVHTVREGDTLWRIARRYELSMRDIIALNSLDAPFVLRTGQRIRLPPPAQYRVRAGDTLYGISRTFGVDVSEISRLNALRAPYTIRKGQVLRLPSEENTPPAPKAVMAAPVSAPEPAPVSSRSAPHAAAVVSSRASSSSSPSVAVPAGKFLWPVEGKVISGFGPKDGGLHNDGINIKAARGTPVRAAREGSVVYAGRELAGYGNLVLIRHDGGWITAYAHMERILVKKGQAVRAGEAIGAVGSSGSVDSPQVHFEIRQGRRALDPKTYL